MRSEINGYNHARHYRQQSDQLARSKCFAEYKDTKKKDKQQPENDTALLRRFHSARLKPGTLILHLPATYAQAVKSKMPAI